MSYTKQTWATGDIVTADKLNHMEDGIAGGGSAPLVCYFDENLGHLNVTFGAIVEAVDAGRLVVHYSNHTEGEAFHSRATMFTEYEINVTHDEQDQPNGYYGTVSVGNFYTTDVVETLDAMYAEYPFLAD